jgi:hypothetical protein
MPTTTDTTMTGLGVLDAFGYNLCISYREGADGPRHFAICALGGCCADTPLGEVGLTSSGMLYPGLNADAEHLGFGLAATGGAVLMRFLVALSAALDGEGLDAEWDFTPDPGSPIPSAAPTSTRGEAAWAR